MLYINIARNDFLAQRRILPRLVVAHILFWFCFKFLAITVAVVARVLLNFGLFFTFRTCYVYALFIICSESPIHTRTHAVSRLRCAPHNTYLRSNHINNTSSLHFMPAQNNICVWLCVCFQANAHVHTK